MKLLFDQNLSPRLIPLFQENYPGSTHVREHNRQGASDETVWEFARDNNFVIVSKDADFHERSFLFGFPPKVIWLRTGNTTTNDLANILRTRQEIIKRFYEDPETSFLILP